MSGVRILPIALTAALGLLASCAQAQADRSSTPFRECRWLLGLTGTISSGSIRTDSTSSEDFSLEYSLRLSGARFVSDRVAVGGFMRGDRASAGRYINRETESILIGPQAGYYFSKAAVGSMFVNVGLGYSRFYDGSDVIVGGASLNQLLRGQGVGALATVGYAVVVADRIVFELGLDYLTSWIWAERELNAVPVGDTEKLRTNELAFSFAFKVLL